MKVPLFRNCLLGWELSHQRVWNFILGLAFLALKDLECYGFESRPKLEAECDEWLIILHVMHDFFLIHNMQTRSWPGRSESEPLQRTCEYLIIGDTFSNGQSAP